eukprot:Hpha_TRINITY_DN15877_c3_g2::TRINITY_DN15877_c3_g2_i5::g.189834::m.189834
MRGCCRWEWLVRQGDTPDEARTRTLGFPFALFVCLVYVFLVVIALLGTSYQVVNVIGNATGAFAFLVFVMGALQNVIPMGYVLDATLVLASIGICAVDLGQATTSWAFRAWALVVLVLDG